MESKEHNGYIKTRWEFEKHSGGKDKIEYAHKFYEKPEYDCEPSCVCGHPIKEVYTVRNKVTNNVHLVGSTCINYYLGTTGFGGKNGVKQGSYAQLAKGIRAILEKKSKEDKDRFEDILYDLEIIGHIYYNEDKLDIEKLIGGNVRFKSKGYTRLSTERIKHLENMKKVMDRMEEEERK